jgi:hypothetical protein
MYFSANIIWVIESRGGQRRDVWQELGEKKNSRYNLQRGAEETRVVTIKTPSKMSIMVIEV